MHYLDYREKLGIGFNDKQKVEYFLIRMNNILKEIPFDALNLNKQFVYDYYNEIGTELEIIYDEREFYTVISKIRNTVQFKEMLARYMTFLNMLNTKRKGKYNQKYFFKIIKDNLEAARIQYTVFEDDDGFYIFPKGAEELDNALVSEPLAWLSEYPKTHIAFIKALREYSEASPDNASDIADKFRKSLETFMQEFFDTDKTLENCKAIYGGYLKEQGVPKEISGNLETLLNTYTTFMNSYAKLHDKTSTNVLEYIMYQTGNIIWLLITLKQGENKNAD